MMHDGGTDVRERMSGGRGARSASLIRPAPPAAPGLAALGAALAALQGVSPAAAQEPPEAFATQRFVLVNQALPNLHHFLLNWASADAGERPPFAQELVEHARGLDALDAAERSIWSEAAAAYGATVGRSLLFDQGLLSVRDFAAGGRGRDEVPESDRALVDALRAALPVYERHWWADHSAGNARWIDAVLPSLRRTEIAIGVRLAAAYGGAWPEGPVPVEVVAYANPVGAYSTVGRVTISSADTGNRMPQALELVFHEASHVDGMERPLTSAIERAFADEGGEAPDRFWHDAIFYTAGEITRIVLTELGEPGYRHYGELGVYTRDARWPPELEAFREHWKPFLDSGSDDDGARREALRGVARRLLDGR